MLRCSTCSKPRKPKDRTHRNQSPLTKLSNTNQHNAPKLVRATIYAIVPEICVTNSQRSFNAPRQGAPIKQYSSYKTVECNSHLYHPCVTHNTYCTSKSLLSLATNSYTQTENQGRKDGDSQTSETRLITAERLSTFRKYDEKEEVYCFEELLVQLPSREKGNASTATPNEQNKKFQEDGYEQDIKSYHFHQQQKPMTHEYRPPSPPSSPFKQKQSFSTNKEYTEVKIFSSSSSKPCTSLTTSSQHQEFIFNPSRYCSPNKNEPEFTQTTFPSYMHQPLHVQSCIMHMEQRVKEELQTIPCILPVFPPSCCPPKPIALYNCCLPLSIVPPNCCPSTPFIPSNAASIPCYSPPPFLTPGPSALPPLRPEQPPPGPRGMMVKLKVPEKAPQPPPPPAPVEIRQKKMNCKCKSTINMSDCSCTASLEKLEYICQKEETEECEICGGKQQQPPVKNKKEKKREKRREKSENRGRKDKSNRSTAKRTYKQPCECPPKISELNETLHYPKCYLKPIVPPPMYNMIQCPVYDQSKSTQASARTQPQVKNFGAEGGAGCTVQ